MNQSAKEEPQPLQIQVRRGYIEKTRIHDSVTLVPATVLEVFEGSDVIATLTLDEGECYYIWVREDRRRRRLATHLWGYARAIGLQPRHAMNRTSDGDAWARSLKEALPELKLVKPLERQDPDDLVRHTMAEINQLVARIKQADPAWHAPCPPLDEPHKLLIIEVGSVGIHTGSCDNNNDYWIYDGESSIARPLLVKRLERHSPELKVWRK